MKLSSVNKLEAVTVSGDSGPWSIVGVMNYH